MQCFSIKKQKTTPHPNEKKKKQIIKIKRTTSACRRLQNPRDLQISVIVTEVSPRVAEIAGYLYRVDISR